jgi:acyl carrier protein
MENIIKNLNLILIKMGFEIRISPQSNFIRDIGMDSLDFAEFIMILEETYSITIAENEVTNLKTVGEMASYLTLKMPSMSVNE